MTGDELTVWRDDHVTTWPCDELTGRRRALPGPAGGALALSQIP